MSILFCSSVDSPAERAVSGFDHKRLLSANGCKRDGIGELPVRQAPFEVMYQKPKTRAVVISNVRIRILLFNPRPLPQAIVYLRSLDQRGFFRPRGIDDVVRIFALFLERHLSVQPGPNI